MMPTSQSETSAVTATNVASGALTGIRVLEIGSLIAGPFAGRLLADHGADVIKIEAPGRPDPLRTWGQAVEDGRGFFWTIHARNKRCITLDLSRGEGRALFLDLAVTSDVVVENFRPGTLERWGIGYDVLQARNARLILARVSGYGQTGPRAQDAGYASMAEAVAGMRYITGFSTQPPVRMGLSLGDSIAGMFAAQGILSALIARERTGVGQVIDVALTEACLALTESMIPDFDRAGIVRQPSGTRLDRIAPSNVYLTADQRWVIVAANQDTVFRRLCDAMGKPELAHDPRFTSHTQRGQHQEALDTIISAWVAGFSRDELIPLLRTAGVVVGPVNTVAEVVRDEQLISRDAIVNHYDEGVRAPIAGPGVIPLMGGTPGQVKWSGPPRPGTHNIEVFQTLLGIEKAQLDDLARAGVI